MSKTSATGSHIPCVGGTYPLRAGNAVRPWIGGEHAFRRICEAVEGARKSVYVTVAFLEPDVALPDGRGHLFDVLDAAAARGIDVRALFWRSPLVEEYLPGEHLLGTAEDHAGLRARAARFHARWDQLDKTYCHHQKSWVVDAGEPDELAFVGGINLDKGSVTAHPFPHRAEGSTEDIYVELRGPAATDVHHNFVQRWNGASDRLEPLGAWPAPDAVSDLEFPHQVSPPAGETPVQLTRTVRRGFYDDATPTPGGEPVPLDRGEYRVLEQYLAAIDAAREAIYFENQTFMAPDVMAASERALERGVEVFVLLPGQPSGMVTALFGSPALDPIAKSLEALARSEHFTFAGLAATRGPGAYDPVYVHTKAAIVDDVFATIGSTNVANRSFFGDTELNASFFHPAGVRAFREELLGLHAGRPLAGDLRDALLELRGLAHANAARRTRGERLEGFVYAVDPVAYLTPPA